MLENSRQRITLQKNRIFTEGSQHSSIFDQRIVEEKEIKEVDHDTPIPEPDSKTFKTSNIQRVTYLTKQLPL